MVEEARQGRLETKAAEKRMALAEAALEALVAPDREPTSVTDLLPQPKRRRRAA